MAGDWNPTLKTRDGEVIEPSSEFAGTHTDSSPDSPSTASSIDATEIRTHASASDVDWHDRFRCPECGHRYDTERDQADCRRAHARRLADKLAELAAEGIDVLPVDGRGERAQLSPLGTIALVGAVAALLIVAIAIGVIYA